ARHKDPHGGHRNRRLPLCAGAGGGVSGLVSAPFDFRNPNWCSLCQVIEVILPVLDEADALPHVLAAFPEGFSPLVVDNGSADGSGSVAAKLGARVVVEPRRGFGSACYAGLVAASSSVLCFMDCDGSLDPAELVRVTG